MSENGYAARIDTEWLSFTPQHARIRDEAFSIARGDHPVATGAVVGVYGSGKSTLLFAVLARMVEEGVLPVWEEASSFLDRIVPVGERTSPHEFVERVHRWVEALRTDSDVLAAYRRDMERRQLGGVADLVEAALRRPTERAVLLLDEMEQAYPHFLQRIETADHQPLRDFVDSCANSRVRLLMAYAPESFLALGDADQGRMVRLAVPSLDSSAIQKAFGLSRAHANFAWWASRGRARGVLKAVKEVIEPYKRGDFEFSWLGLAEAIKGLPSVFGVPAVLRENIPAESLRDLIELSPHPDSGAPRSYFVDLRDRLTLAARIMEKLADFSRSRREDVEVIVHELLGILDAISNEEQHSYLTFDDFSAALKLAGARAIESGRLGQLPEGMEPGSAYYHVAIPNDFGWMLPFSLSRLADEIFPSPFTDPVLPLTTGKLPAQTELDRLFKEMATEDIVFHWKERGSLIFRDLKALDKWLTGALTGPDENARWRILLLDDAGKEGSLTLLAREAGRIAIRSIGAFHACFIKCLAIRAGEASLETELDMVASAARAQDRQLGRKVEWHLSRIGRLTEEMDPTPQQRWVAAIAFSRGERLIGVFNRLSEDSPGLLALLYPFKPSRPETRKTLAELGEILAEGGELRKLARAADPQKKLAGATVVVDLLPTRPGSTVKRWIETDFVGRRELTEILETFASGENAGALAKLLQPHFAGRMERVIRFHTGELPDLKPERQQLDGLQEINAVMQRARSVQKGIQSLLGVREEVTGLAIGRLISQACAAQKSIDAFNRLAGRLDKIEEPWARALALWVGAVFAERIWDGVERDIATLKAWEAASEKGKNLSGVIEERLDELTECGFTRMKEYINLERARVKSGLTDVEQMQVKIHELEGTLNQVSGLISTLKALKELAAERNTEISLLLQTYRPEAGRINEDREAIERVLSLLGRIDEEWPAPGDEDLRSYLARLREFGELSYAERLRARVAQVLGVPVISKDIVLDSDDVVKIEENWPNLAPGFAEACMDAIEGMPPTGSDKLVVWIAEAIEKQALLANVPQDHRLTSTDEKTRTWAMQVEVRPTQLGDLLASRGRTIQLLSNLGRAVRPSVIEELINVANKATLDQAQRTLEKEARNFHNEMEKLAAKLVEVRGPVQRPFPGATRAAVVAELDVARRVSEERRNELHQRLLGLANVITHLGGRPRPIPSPLTVPEAEQLAAVESDDARKLLAKAWGELTSRLQRLGVEVAVAERPQDASEAEDLRCFESISLWCDVVEQEANALSAMGLAFPSVAGDNRDGVLEKFRSAATEARENLEELKECVRLALLRLQRMGGPSTTAEYTSLTNICEARSALDQLRSAADKMRGQLLSRASSSAQDAYHALLAGGEDRGEPIAPFLELRHLGLIRTIEDDL